MGSKKGHTNNPAGRTVGSKNQRTKQWESLGDDICTRHAERFNNVMDELENEEFIKAFGLIVQYFKPKLASTTLDAKVDTRPQIIMQDVSGQEIDEDVN